MGQVFLCVRNYSCQSYWVQVSILLPLPKSIQVARLKLDKQQDHQRHTWSRQAINWKVPKGVAHKWGLTWEPCHILNLGCGNVHSLVLRDFQVLGWCSSFCGLQLAGHAHVRMCLTLKSLKSWSCKLCSPRATLRTEEAYEVQIGSEIDC